ncbi:NUDIX domain-containing protein [Halobacillus fulvus]|nr:NUDIX domain-containing protein [Halobacillus fulvus]
MGYIEDIRALVGNRPLILNGSVVIVIDDQDRILLEQRTYPEGVWGLPGGLMELGESTEEVARRELWEETGLKAGTLHLIDIYSGSDQFTVAANGDQFYTVTTSYYTKDVEGTLKNDPDESFQCTFIHPAQFPEKMIGSHRMMIEDYLRRVKE